MATLFNRKFEYIELGSGSYDASGNYVAGEKSSRIVRGTIQSVSGDDLLRIPEGNRQTGAVKIYSSEKLNVRTQNGAGVGYVRTVAGIVYQLEQELPFPNLPKITHWKYLACEIPKAQIPEALQ